MRREIQNTGTQNLHPRRGDSARRYNPRLARIACGGRYPSTRNLADGPGYRVYHNVGGNTGDNPISNTRSDGSDIDADDGRGVVGRVENGPSVIVDQPIERMRAQLVRQWDNDDSQKCRYCVPNVVPIDLADTTDVRTK